MFQLSRFVAIQFTSADMFKISDGEGVCVVEVPENVAKRVGVWKDMLEIAEGGSDETVRLRNSATGN